VFLLAAVPGAAAVAVLWWGVRESPRAVPARHPAAAVPGLAGGGALGATFWRYLGVLLLFTLGNASDAFLLLRAADLGVATALVPLLWALLHVVKSASSALGGDLSDRLGRRPLIVAGWLVYAAVYLLFARASAAWHAWALFTVYGVYFGLTEGVEKALVADLAPAGRRGTAFGWYNLAVGIGALPASVIFGLVWDRAGPAAAFQLGAGLAFAAAVGFMLLVPARGRGNATA